MSELQFSQIANQIDPSFITEEDTTGFRIEVGECDQLTAITRIYKENVEYLFGTPGTRARKAWDEYEMNKIR